MGRTAAIILQLKVMESLTLPLCRDTLTQAKQLLYVAAQSMEISLRLIPIPRRSATIMISDKTTKK